MIQSVLADQQRASFPVWLIRPLLFRREKSYVPTNGSASRRITCFAPNYAPEEILEIASKLYQKAKNL
jgi:hypothetical protein